MRKIVIMIIFVALFITIPLSITSATTLSNQMYNAILLNYPTIYGNEYYGIEANYINGYGMWNSYKDYYWCSLNNGNNFSGWTVYPRITKYYDNNQQIYNTSGTRYTNTEPAYYPGDLLLFTDTADFSIYTSYQYSKGIASTIATAYDFNTGTEIYMSLELSVNY